MSKRRPAVAGQFYPGTAREMREMLAELIEPGAPKAKAIGAMGPHAGWIYSGRGAGMLYSRLEIPETVIVLCPNHRGMGAEIAVMSEGSWDLPTGEVRLAGDLARAIMKRCSLVTEDSRAHSAEHSLEVHLPFIQHFRPDFKLVPFSLGRVSFGECQELGTAMAEAVKAFGKEVLDPEGLYQTVIGNRITMCGVIPAAVMLIYALARGATKAELIDYRNSGDVTGDRSEVVAYASVIVK
jgi:hypothetical protein